MPLPAIERGHRLGRAPPDPNLLRAGIEEGEIRLAVAVVVGGDGGHAAGSDAAHADFGHGSDVCEFGCGTGKFAEGLLEDRLAADARYVGIDISTTMVGIAGERLSRWRERATVQQVDGSANLRFTDRAFDRFVATYVFDLLSESAIARVLAEAHRMLRPGGKLCVAGLTDGVTPLSRVVGSVWKRVHAFNPRLVGDCRPLHMPRSLDRSA